MSIIRAIPKKLLIHTVIYAREEESDRWGTVSLMHKQEVRYVRMETSGKIIRDKTNAEIQLAATLFYDCKNSRPKGVTFHVDDIIFFQNEKYKVQLVEPLYDGECLHHYELGVIKYA
nr:MAG TPA: Minor capsid protein [Caudoviricetes sp.]